MKPQYPGIAVFFWVTISLYYEAIYKRGKLNIAILKSRRLD
jgi:hypothetical protein